MGKTLSKRCGGCGGAGYQQYQRTDSDEPAGPKFYCFDCGGVGEQIDYDALVFGCADDTLPPPSAHPTWPAPAPDGCSP